MLNGSVIKAILASDSEAKGSFAYAKINLVKAACPREIASSRQNVANGNPIVIEKNRNFYGKASTGYVPVAIVVAGGNKRADMLKRGIISAFAWVEAGAMVINADDAIGCQELMTKLNAVLGKKFPSTASMSYPGSSVWIVEVYPFENYAIYSQMGKNYRQHYSLDPITRTVALQGTPTEVKTTYVNASVSGMGLVSQICHGHTDMVEAVSTYLNAIKHGNYIPLQPDFAPVQINGFGHISNVLAASGISPVDFAIWSSKSGSKEAIIKQIATKDKKKPFADAKDKMDKLRGNLQKLKAAGNQLPASMSTPPPAAAMPTNQKY